MFTIVTTEHFFRRSRRFLKQHPELRQRLAQLTDDLKVDPFARHLKYHHLAGSLKGTQAVSLTESYRIILTIVVTEKQVILLDIGSHDEVYR